MLVPSGLWPPTRTPLRWLLVRPELAAKAFVDLPRRAITWAFSGLKKLVWCVLVLVLVSLVSIQKRNRHQNGHSFECVVVNAIDFHPVSQYLASCQWDIIHLRFFQLDAFTVQQDYQKQPVTKTTS